VPLLLKDILYEKAEQRLVEKELSIDKSTRLGEWSSSDHNGSLRNNSETLYANDLGDYFIIYEGGLDAGFHNLPGVESWFGGTYTRQVSIEDAFAWCEETGNHDVIKSHFPFVMIATSRRGVGE